MSDDDILPNTFSTAEIYEAVKSGVRCRDPAYCAERLAVFRRNQERLIALRVLAATTLDRVRIDALSRDNELLKNAQLPAILEIGKKVDFLERKERQRAKRRGRVARDNPRRPHDDGLDRYETCREIDRYVTVEKMKVNAACSTVISNHKIPPKVEITITPESLARYYRTWLKRSKNKKRIGLSVAKSAKSLRS